MIATQVELLIIKNFLLSLQGVALNLINQRENLSNMELELGTNNNHLLAKLTSMNFLRKLKSNLLAEELEV